MRIETDIVLYRASLFSYNAQIVQIVMVMLNLQFQVQAIDTENDEHMQDWYKELNPNYCDTIGSIPVITDTLSDGEKITLFDTATILEYITERYDNESRIKAHFGRKSNLQATSWLYWVLGYLAPLQLQAIFAIRPSEGMDRKTQDYLTNELRRLYRNLDDLIKKSTHGYMVGDRPTIADIACFGWVYEHSNAGISIEEFEEFSNVQRWRWNMFNWIKTRVDEVGMASQFEDMCAAYSQLRM
ncbi:hypothetical protein E4U17_005766 [Claviceps sp. LM77 group G4]|nr:hypothetical protein E4U17_005766 [Claviceps sp. LM77 group G4]KAG6079671.1 hypothetical protein E4U33_000113 [Claviceps sp. LM78 group G4]